MIHPFSCCWVHEYVGGWFGLVLFRVLQGVRVLEVGWDRYHPPYYAVYVLIPFSLFLMCCLVPVCVCFHYHYARPVCASGVPFANQVTFLSFIVFSPPDSYFLFFFLFRFRRNDFGFLSPFSVFSIKEGREGGSGRERNEGRGGAFRARRGEAMNEWVVLSCLSCLSCCFVLFCLWFVRHSLFCFVVFCVLCFVLCVGVIECWSD